MPPVFFSISIFRESLDQLCRKEKFGYHHCRKDICELFQDQDFGQIWEMNYLLRDLGDIRLIKIRVQNSHQSLSKADGFRLIVICNRKDQSMNFLNLYPKRGKLGKLDQTPEDTKRQLANYISAKKANTLVKHNILKNIEEMGKA